MDNRISVIVPIYKTEPYLRRCVDSILAQTYPHLEIILVDDGSPDGCGAICDAYAAADPRVRVIHRSNGGLSAARNSGLDVATGEYISFIDSDDAIEICTYEIMLRHALKSQADMIQCGYVHTEEMQYTAEGVPDSEIPCHEMTWHQALVDLLDSGVGFRCCSCDKLYKRAVFDELRFVDVRSEDFVMNYQLLKRQPRVLCLRIPLYHYIIRPDSITTGTLKQTSFDFLDMLKDMEKAEEDESLLPHWKIQKAVSARNMIIPQIVSGTFPEKFKSLRRDILGARFALLSKKYPYIDRKFKLHILLLWLCPPLYRRYIRKKRG